jgi:hypothetical protein
MKAALIAFLLAICFCNTVFCQVSVLGHAPGPPPQRHMTPEEFNIKVIKYLLTFTSPLQNGNVQVHRMGDRAAGYILKILESRPPLNAAEQQTALDIVQKAYEKPAVILNGADRRSTAATSNLLQVISDSTQDFNVKLRIADIKQSVLATAAASP